MRIAVTGGAGYIGSKLCRKLLALGYHVVCIDWMEWGVTPILGLIDHPNFDVFNVDICSPDIEPIITSCDAVIHLAGIVGFPACNAHPDVAYNVNVLGTQRVIDATGDKPFVYASTGSVYGSLGTVCDETSPVNPISNYSVYKLQGEEYLASNPNGVILRPATAFGVSDRLRNDLLINDFVRKAINGEDMILFEGHFKRTFLGVDDLASAFVLGIEQNDRMKSNIWNVGDDSLNLTKIEICQVIQSYIPNWKYELNESLTHDLDKRDYYVDYTKIKSIGFYATRTLSEGIQDLIKIYRIMK